MPERYSYASIVYGRGFDRNHGIVKPEFFENGYVVKRAFGKRDGTGIFFENALFDRAGIHADADRNSVAFTSGYDFGDFAFVAYVTGVKSDLVKAYIRARDGVTIIELNIRNERRARFSDNIAASVHLVVRTDCDTNYVAPDLFERTDLIERARVIESRRIRHRLDRNRFAAADIKISDFNSAGHSTNPRISIIITKPNNKSIPTA